MAPEKVGDTAGIVLVIALVLFVALAFAPHLIAPST